MVSELIELLRGAPPEAPVTVEGEHRDLDPPEVVGISQDGQRVVLVGSPPAACRPVAEVLASMQHHVVREVIVLVEGEYWLLLRNGGPLGSFDADDWRSISLVERERRLTLDEARDLAVEWGVDPVVVARWGHDSPSHAGDDSAAVNA